jgi:hemoglobin
VTGAPRHAFAEAKRAEIRAAAAEMGIDEAYLGRLVDRFYDRVRADALLGPVFEREIGGQWEPHLARMKAFWASVALNAGTYSGRPVAVHQRLEGVTRGHFVRWLELFHDTLAATAPSAEAVDYLMSRAERIGANLQAAMFEREPDLRVGLGNG